MRGVAIGPVRMTLLPIVAGLAALAVVTSVALSERTAIGCCVARRGRRAECLERLERGGEIAWQRIDGQLLAGGPLDIAQVAALFARTESNRDAGRAGARGAANAVDILLGDIGQVEIDDV